MKINNLNRTWFPYIIDKMSSIQLKITVIPRVKKQKPTRYKVNEKR